MSNLYLGNLSYQISEKEIRELFQGFGEIESIKLFADKGFGFINFEKEADAKEALKELYGTSLLGRELKIDVARPRKDSYPNRYKS